MSLLQSPQPVIEAVLGTVLNDLSAISNDVVIVLDDYHLIEARAVHDGMAFLLERLPPQVHLVLATRADPPLQLARWRGRGELLEIRAADLRFTTDEAAAYLDDVTGLDTHGTGRRRPGEAHRRVDHRDPAGGAVDAGPRRHPGLHRGFRRGRPLHRRLPGRRGACSVSQKTVRSFLLETSILSRLNGPLCEAVTGRGGGGATLEALEHGNLFLFPLDDRRQWYRYHHLFADVLQARLLDEQPEDLTELHRRASDWCEQNGERSEAIRHAMAGKQIRPSRGAGRAGDASLASGPT